MDILTKVRQKFVYEMRRRFGVLEPLAGLRRFAVEPPVRHVVDGGAHHGHFAERLARVFPEAIIHCFEPAPENFARLEARLGGHPRFRLNRAALAASDGTMALHLNSHDQTHSLLPWATGGRRDCPGETLSEGRVEVEALALDGYLEREQISRVGLLKLDLQGGEAEALRGAARSLARGIVDCIFTECFFFPHYEGAPLAHELSALLETHGYSLFDFAHLERTEDGRLSFGDAVYVSPGARAVP